MHYDYDYDYDNDKKQDTNSVLQTLFIESGTFLLQYINLDAM